MFNHDHTTVPTEDLRKAVRIVTEQRDKANDAEFTRIANRALVSCYMTLADRADTERYLSR